MQNFDLVIIHPTMYRHMMAGAPEQFARFATERSRAEHRAPW